MTSHAPAGEPGTTRATLRIGTRASLLARTQTRLVADAIGLARPDVSIVERLIGTTGDQLDTQRLDAIGGTGLFTRELERALLNGEIDVAVHSLKDLPTVLEAGLCIAAVPVREVPWDALVSSNGLVLAELPRGARIGTSSPRRTAQLLAARPDLSVEPIRGNLDTRLRKVLDEDWDAIVVAAAGLSRIGRLDEATQIFPPETLLPAVGQGALGLQTREDDSTTVEVLRTISDAPSERAVTAERAFLHAMGGGCQLPIAAVAQAEDEQLRLDGIVLSTDGRQQVRGSATDVDPVALGDSLAAQMMDDGANELLSEMAR